MKASELRIGNFVDTKEHKSVIISSINSINDGLGYIWHNHNFGYYQLRTFEPIPLTEEWLLKFGFENSGVDKRTFCDSYKKKNIKLLLSNSGNFYYGKLYIGTVHQLQNLYFALTNKELTYEQD